MQYIGVQHDVTARVEAERALVQRARPHRAATSPASRSCAYTDPLTGLPNRRRLEEQVEAAIWTARAGGDALALLFVDLDGFKRGQRRARPRRGRRAAVGAPRTPAQPAAPRRPAGRLGGEEFLVVLAGLDASHGAAPRRSGCAEELAARRARARCRSAASEVVVRASVGAAVYPADGEDVERAAARRVGRYARCWSARRDALTRALTPPSADGAGAAARPGRRGRGR